MENREERNMLTLQEFSSWESNEVCAICLDKTEVETVKVLQCSHFHSQSIGMWVARKSSCPACRCAIRPIFIFIWCKSDRQCIKVALSPTV
ncbi:hypothetical protein AMTRI_Chr06g177000 [Amborella trichopoda]